MSAKIKQLKADIEMLQGCHRELTTVINEADKSENTSDILKYMNEKSKCERLLKEKKKEYQFELAKRMVSKKTGKEDPSIIAKTTGGAGTVNIRASKDNFRVGKKTPTQKELLEFDAAQGHANIRQAN